MQTFERISHFDNFNIINSINDLKEKFNDEIHKFLKRKINYDDMLKKKNKKEIWFRNLRKKREIFMKKCKNNFESKFTLFHSLKRNKSEEKIKRKDLYYHLLKYYNNYKIFKPYTLSLNIISKNNYINLTDINQVKIKKKNNKLIKKNKINIQLKKNFIKKDVPILRYNKKSISSVKISLKKTYSTMTIFEFKKTHSNYLPNISNELSNSIKESKKLKKQLSNDKKKFKRNFSLITQNPFLINKKNNLKLLKRDLINENNFQNSFKKTIKFKGLKINKYGKIKYKKEKSLDENIERNKFIDELNNKFNTIFSFNKTMNLNKQIEYSIESLFKYKKNNKQLF